MNGDWNTRFIVELVLLIALVVTYIVLVTIGLLDISDDSARPGLGR
jgi:hypothetical protein